MHRMQSGGWPYSKVGRDSDLRKHMHAIIMVPVLFIPELLRPSLIVYISVIFDRDRQVRFSRGVENFLQKHIASTSQS